MSNFSSKMSQLRSKIQRAQSGLQQAQRRLESDLRRAKYQLEHPTIEIRCTCGYHGRGSHDIRHLPENCPSCGAPIRYA